MVEFAVNTVLVIIGFVGGLVVGASVGLLGAEAYHSKRECRECMRRIVKRGFRVDGKNYKAAEDGR